MDNRTLTIVGDSLKDKVRLNADQALVFCRWYGTYKGMKSDSYSEVFNDSSHGPVFSVSIDRSDVVDVLTFLRIMDFI
tara:strand:- start:7443 stop:7676 length:234 start_codon:yes stop_codon:yes gene_type:complete